MKRNDIYTCCFFGHREIEQSEQLKKAIETAVENLITEKNVDTFLFGSKSEFDSLCHSIVTDIKQKYPHIKRVYVRAEFKYIDEEYKTYLLENYEDTYFPHHILKAGKSTYIQRNTHMIDKSNFCVVYYDEKYTPKMRKTSKKSLSEYQPKSGTKAAFEYAVKNNRQIINVINSIAVTL